MNSKEKFEEYVSYPERFWSADNVFHKRNVSKVIKSVKNFGGVRKAVDVVFSAAVERHCSRPESVNGFFLTSCGGSGCHFIGNVFSANVNVDMINEVYIPPCFSENALLVDAVNLLHSCFFSNNNLKISVINTAHLRKDFSFNDMSDFNFKVYGIIRNPFDIVRSLTFRKEEWRLMSTGVVSDEDYLKSRINHVLRYYRQLEKINVSGLVRYEDVKSSPVFYSKAFLMENKLYSDACGIDKHVSKFDSRKGSPEKSLNFSPEDSRALPHSLSSIMLDYLSDLAFYWDYEIPGYCKK